MHYYFDVDVDVDGEQGYMLRFAEGHCQMFGDPRMQTKKIRKDERASGRYF